MEFSAADLRWQGPNSYSSLLVLDQVLRFKGLVGDFKAHLLSKIQAKPSEELGVIKVGGSSNVSCYGCLGTALAYDELLLPQASLACKVGCVLFVLQLHTPCPNISPIG
jgi:hypothetical protein